jgi:hypothetical protein
MADDAMEDDSVAVTVAAHVIFGIGGNGAPLQLYGWSFPEPRFTWCVETASSVRIPYQPGMGTLMLELTVTPMVLPPIIRTQRLVVTANGTILGEESIAGESTLGYAVPESVLDSSHILTVTLSYPDAFVPVEIGAGPDVRRLGFSVRDMLLLWVPREKPFTPVTRPPLPANVAGGIEAAVRFCTGLSPADLVHNFESLGHNCEFGLMQRAAGAEPLGLLRFGGISINNLLRGLDMAFEGIDDPSRLRPYTERGRRGEEYLIRDDRYSAAFHTRQLQGDITPEALVAKFAPHLAFLRRQFQGVLEDGSRIFVHHRPGLRSQAEVMPLLNLLRSHGPNVLLYVTEDFLAPDGTPVPTMPAGSVVQERADLFHGYIDEFAPLYDAARLNLPAWLSVCANTYRMWREQGGGG